MQNELIVSINGQSILKYDRSKTLDEKQLLSLEKMDQSMNKGFVLGNDSIAKPDPLQRAQFVSLQLIQALSDNNEPLIAATCAYLANRVPDLKQVEVVDSDDGRRSFDLVFDREYQPEAKIDFFPPRDS